jgi:hypothetical protein
VGHQALAAPGARGENSVRRWTCDGGAFGVMPSLEASHMELVLTCGSGVLVGRWSCSCAAADEEHKVHVGGEVRRGHEGRQPWAGAHGAVVFLTSAWCRWCSQRGFSCKGPCSSVQCDGSQGPRTLRGCFRRV